MPVDYTSVRSQSLESIKSQVIDVTIPYPREIEEGWLPVKLCFGQTASMAALWGHLSVLRTGFWPHSPHKHEQEEILLLISGEADIIIPNAPDGKENRPIRPGDLSYYPANFAHTVKTTSQDPANYLMFKWHGDVKRGGERMRFSEYRVFDPTDTPSSANGFHPKMIFQGQTDFLSRFSCHTSVLAPGAGYEPHADDYDVVIVVLAGEVETLGRRVKPHGVIFYAAGEPHGMRNPGDVPARYVVFEFQGWPNSALARRFWPLIRLWAKIKDPERWQRKFKQIFGPRGEA